MSPGGAEWGLVAVTVDLGDASRTLGQLAFDFRQEARSWTHPAGRGQLEDIASELTTQAQAAALASSAGDYWERFDALKLAHARIAAARYTLRLWWQRGELWNSHRVRPVPASIGGLQG